MKRTMLARAVCGALVGACTPLGLWIYEDPIVTVSRVTLELGKPRLPAASPVVVALDVHNRNDFPLSTTRMELSLRLDGIPIGRLKQDNRVALATDGVSTVALPLQLEKQATPSRLRTLDTGSHVFLVSGRATFETPIGTRKVYFAEQGEMIFGRRGEE
ncbi:MAG TPA: LEA type 2 family protein [Gemmatimonadales bacterium]|nr:LEA type 2 family protein [Gemmatimonadales bacterium]